MDSRFLKRKARRRAVISITLTLERILDMEKDYFYSIPVSIANEGRYSESEFFIGILDDVVESLRYIY